MIKFKKKDTDNILIRVKGMIYYRWLYQIVH